MLHIFNGILLSHKKNEIMPFAATWIDLKIITLTEVNRETNTTCYHLYICGIQNMTQMNFFTKQKQTQRHRKQIYVYRRRQGEGGIH